jgi:hypothetical protein
MEDEMDLADTLFALEHELGDGDGTTYDRLLTDDAIVVVPGATMTKQETVDAMNAGPGWSSLVFDGERCVPLNGDTALLTYRFTGRRGEDFEYVALMGSVYVRRPQGWRMAFHQQTPLG